MLGGHGFSCYPLELFVGANYHSVGFGQVRVIVPWNCLLSQGCWHHDQHGYKGNRSQVEYSLHNYSVSFFSPKASLYAIATVSTLDTVVK